MTINVVVPTTQKSTASLRSQVRACRSFLLTPGSRLDSLQGARAAGADSIIVDLESTVGPDNKRQAREAAFAFLDQPAEADFVRILRINSPRSVTGLHDLLALKEANARPDALIIPKCQSADETGLVIDILDGPLSSVGVIPMIELAQAVFVADRIAQAHDRVCGLFLGGGDLAADLGAEGSWQSLLFARSVVVAAAATAGIAAIDVPYFKGDAAGLRREAMASRKLGMTGKSALQAEQLAAINTIFTPSADAVTRARSVAAARAAAGTSTPVIAGHVVEPAMEREAERVLAIANRFGIGAQTSDRERSREDGANA
ncbi:(S)-citramalyl-CoA lyase [Bradyrhizobium sp. GM6.1]